MRVTIPCVAETFATKQACSKHLGAPASMQSVFGRCNYWITRGVGLRKGQPHSRHRVSKQCERLLSKNVTTKIKVVAVVVYCDDDPDDLLEPIKIAATRAWKAWPSFVVRCML